MRLQPPQWPGSVWVFTQNMPMPTGGEQAVWPGGHIPQRPVMQTCPVVHARPHMPQFIVSKRVSTQAEPQRVWPVPQAVIAPQRPPPHT